MPNHIQNHLTVQYCGSVKTVSEGVTTQVQYLCTLTPINIYHDSMYSAYKVQDYSVCGSKYE